MGKHVVIREGERSWEVKVLGQRDIGSEIEIDRKCDERTQRIYNQ